MDAEAPVAVSVSVGPDLGRGGAPAGVGGALGIGGELALGRVVALDAKVGTGFYADAHVGLDALVGLRAWLKPPTEPLSFSVVGRVGATLVPTPSPEAWLGLDVGVRSDQPLSFRLGVGGQLLSSDGTDALFGVGSPVAGELHVGVTWRPHRAVEAVAPAPEPAASPPVSSRVVWVPHPVCMWVPIADLPTVLADLPGDTSAWVVEGGLAPGTSTLVGAASTTLAVAPAQGAVVVGGATGDRVTIGGASLPVGPASGVVVAAPPGAFRADILGNGRDAVVEGAVADGWILWLRAPAPQPTSVRFGLNSSVIDAGGKAVLQELARRRGDAVFVIRGGYSSEGDPVANAALADARAGAVRDELARLGVPADRLVVEAGAPIVGDTEQSRVAVVTARGAP